MKLSLTISRRCLAQLQECSPCLTSYCGCARALPPTNTPCSSELWWRLVDGMRQLFSAHIGRDLVPVSLLRWWFMMIPLDWRDSCKKTIESPSAYQPATPLKTAHQSVSPATSSPVPEPMQVDSTFSCKTRSPTCCWTLPLLCRYRSLHWDLPHQTPTSWGEYHLVRSRNFHAFHAFSATIHSSPFCYSLSPCRLGLLGQLHIARPTESSSAASSSSCPGAQSQNNPRITARTWAHEL